jgi:hypothetical protein
MDTRQILTEVKAEISRLQKVVDLLEGGTPTSNRAPTTQVAKTTTKRKGHQWTEAERRAMSLKQKARWAKNKSAASDKPKRTISAASRRKMAAAQKARWAKAKAQQKKAA